MKETKDQVLPKGQTRDRYTDIKTVLWFAEQGMLKKLAENAHKSHWLHDGAFGWHETLDCLLNRVSDEFRELVEAVHRSPTGNSGTFDIIQREASDLSNFSMFIADNEREIYGRPLESKTLDCVEMLRKMAKLCEGTGVLTCSERKDTLEAAESALKAFDDLMGLSHEG